MIIQDQMNFIPSHSLWIFLLVVNVLTTRKLWPEIVLELEPPPLLVAIEEDLLVVFTFWRPMLRLLLEGAK